ncbi:hypothetical protein QFZ66_006254 [Streptomyces sp. B4I13]|nr:hypothetical protein [Streptomyces sp. B4I13]
MYVSEVRNLRGPPAQRDVRIVAQGEQSAAAQVPAAPDEQPERGGPHMRGPPGADPPSASQARGSATATASRTGVPAASSAAAAVPAPDVLRHSPPPL